MARPTPRIGWIDAALGTVALLIGLCSLWFPFGRDQGLFYYVGREWLERGAIPYRDVWDHKPPPIYAVHALAIALFGEGMASIRILEWLSMPVAGWLLAGVAVPRQRAMVPGTWGAAWLCVSLAYHGCNLYWDTAQCELWCGLFALASLYAAIRTERLVRAAFLSGALAAIAIWFKPPAVFLAVIATGALLHRAARDNPERRRGSAVRAFGVHAAGLVAASTLIVVYFAYHGALAEMADIVVGANAYYVEHERTEPGLRAFMLRLVLVDIYGPILWVPAAVSLFAVASGLYRRRAERVGRYGLCLLWILATAAGVAVQMKMYFYHFGALAIGIGLFGATAHDDLARWQAPTSVERLRTKLSTGQWRTLRAIGFAVVALSLFAATPSSTTWRNVSAATAAYALGWSPREHFAQAFDLSYQNYSYSEAERVGLWLKRHARPSDTLAVRHFEPEIYAISGLRHTGRFFWTVFLTDTRRAYARQRWRAEDRSVFRKAPPDFVVALNRPYDPIDGCAWFRKRGYRIRKRLGCFCILEKQPSPGPPILTLRREVSTSSDHNRG